MVIQVVIGTGPPGARSDQPPSLGCMSPPHRPLRVYLDTADLHRIADGLAAPNDQHLREAIAEVGARVVCSLAHVMDLVEADDGTVSRWSAAVASLGPAEWLFIEGAAARFEEFHPHDVPQWLALVRAAFLPVRALRHAGAEAARDAHLQDEGRARLRGSELRAGAAAILDGGGLIAAACASVGLTRDEALRRVADEPKDALARGDAVDAIRLRLDADRDRRPIKSDMADANHLYALPHVQVFTADRYTATAIEQTLRRPPAGSSPLARRVPVFHLDEVANALREAAL